MLKKQRAVPTYSDGVVTIFRDTAPDTSFGASIKGGRDDLELIAKLAYANVSVRESDFYFAERRGFDVAMKIRTQLIDGPDAGCIARIGNLQYGISYIDKTKTEMFLYLEGGMPYGDAGSNTATA